MSALAHWPPSPLGSVGHIVDALFGLYTERGDTYYDAAVTQTEHALQTAALAEAEDADEALVMAALLHDIGHLLVDEHAGRTAFLTSDAEHERVGARVLRRWFGTAVTGPIALHVPAKRYLVATDPHYAAALSDASVRSLAVQGGPMSSAEVTTFSQRRWARDACRIRRWDDRAKTAGVTSPPFEHYRPRLHRLLRLEMTSR